MDTFTKAYLACALWSSTDNADESGGEPLDKNYDLDDLSAETLESHKKDCEAFQALYRELIAGREEEAGHDFWLNRNGHGAGFWDGDWPEPAATILDHAAEAFGEVDLYVGDDGLIYS